jgi:glycosyltransferase involved in cell wall biosynthesis
LKAVVIGGAWGGANEYEKKVKDYGRRTCGERVTFLGSRSDIPQVYPDLDLAVHPSHSENVGGVCESLLAEVPTIATDVGGFTDMVIQGETGCLVSPKSPKELAKAIVWSLQNRSQVGRMARQGRMRVEQLMNIRQTAKEILDCYGSVTSSQSRSGAGE